MSKRLFMPEHIEFLKEQAAGKTYADLTELFNGRFKTGFTVTQIRNNCLCRRIKTGFYPQARIPKKRHKKIGSEVTDKIKKIKYVKVSDEGMTFKLRGTWKKKHVLIWEEANGPLPEGMSVIFLDGDRNNFEPDNLAAVSYKERLLMGKLGLRFNNKDMTKTGLAIVRHQLTIQACLDKTLGSKDRKLFMSRECTKRRRWRLRASGGEG